MFFKNIATWSKKTMWGVTIACYILYFCIVVLAPAITVLVKYNMFTKDANSYLRVTGFGLIAFVIIGIASYIFIKKALNKLPQDSVPEQRFKFGLETIFDLFPIAIALYVSFAIRDDLTLAFGTLNICLWFFFFGIIFNGLFIKFIDAEWQLRSLAKKDKEKAKRKDVV